MTRRSPADTRPADWSLTTPYAAHPATMTVATTDVPQATELTTLVDRHIANRDDLRLAARRGCAIALSRHGMLAKSAS